MRGKKAKKRIVDVDVVFEREDIARFINYLMKDGKKSLAEKIFSRALEIIKERTKKNPIEVVDKAFENVTPAIEVRSQRVGGANYQVPRPVRPERKFALVYRWILDAARKKKGKSMEYCLAEELIDASNNEGAAVKKKQDMKRVADANKAFAHFARR